MAKTNAKDWRNKPIDEWTVHTFHAYLIEQTAAKFGAEYAPGGRGAKSQRWRAEQGMLKREITQRGPAHVRKFIDVCWREYFTPNPKQYPYPTFGFMAGYMDRYWNVAKAELEEEKRAEESAQQAAEFKAEDYEGWL